MMEASKMTDLFTEVYREVLETHGVHVCEVSEEEFNYEVNLRRCMEGLLRVKVCRFTMQAGRLRHGKVSNAVEMMNEGQY